MLLWFKILSLPERSVHLVAHKRLKGMVLGKMRGESRIPRNGPWGAVRKAWPGEVTPMRSKVRGHRNVEAAATGAVHRVSCV